MTTQPGNPTREPIPFGLALAAGGGLTLMIVALGIGVVQGVSADTNLIGLAFVGGLLLLIAGIIGWFSVVRPFANFDDINEPHYHGHHDDHHGDDAADVTEHADHDAAHAAQPVLPHG